MKLFEDNQHSIHDNQGKRFTILKRRFLSFISKQNQQYHNIWEKIFEDKFLKFLGR